MCGKHIRSEIIVSPGGWRIVGHQLTRGHGLLSASGNQSRASSGVEIIEGLASYPSLVNMVAMSCL